jgi:hypothetical protein
MGKNNWYYQQSNGGNYSDLSFISDEAHPKPYWFGSENCAVGSNYQTPGDNAAVRKWGAPHGGGVPVEGVGTGSDSSADGIMASIWLNSGKVLARQSNHSLAARI